MKNIFMCSLLSALLVLSAAAQTANSRISGTITDASGAVVPGAKVTVKNEATGVAYTQVTTGTGNYAFPSLVVGNYTLRAEMTGFKTVNQTGIVLQVDTPLAVNLALEIGQTTEVVNIEGAFEKLQTTSATIGSVVEQQAIEKLPLNGRNPLSLITLEAGVTPRSGGAGSNLISVNGSRDRAFNVTIDGIDANESSVPTATNNIYRLNPDNIKEYKVTTNNATAEEGRNSGASISVATRSGGNQLHGTVFHFLRNDALNTKEFYANAQGTPKRGMKLNQYGVEASGPIRKNKTFFFGSYQGNNIVVTQPIDQSFGVPIVYSPTALAGNFRYFIPNPASPLVINGTTITRNSPLLVDSATGALRSEVPLCSATVTLGCVQTFNIFGGGRAIDPVVSKLLGTYPRPNTYAAINAGIDGLNTGGYIWNPPTEFRGPAIMGRVDHTFNETNALYGRYLFSDYNTLKGDPLNGRPQVFPGEFPALGEVYRRSHNVAINYRHTFSSRITNEFTVGRSRFVFLFTQGETDKRFPDVPPFDFASISEPFNTTPRTARAVTTPQFIDNLSIVSGSHVIRTGMNMRFYRHVDQRGQPGGINVTPSISFLASVRSPVIAGVTLPTNINANDQTLFLNTINNLLGTPARLSQTFIGDLNANAFLPFQTNGQVNYQGVKHRLNQYNIYVQDEWKARQNLTINYGVRWEINPPPNSGDGFTFVPDKSIVSPLSATPVVGQPGAVTFVKANKWYEGKYLGVIGPRLGLAWSPQGKWFSGKNNSMVIRAGYGIAYDPLSSFQVTAVSGRVPGLVLSCSSTLTNTAPFHNTTPGCTPAVATGATALPTLGGNFPTAVAPPSRKPSEFLNAPLQLYSNAPTLSMFDPQIGLPTVHQWNLSIQRELPMDWVGQVSYIGRRGTHLLRSYDINQINGDSILPSFLLMRTNVRNGCNADGSRPATAAATACIGATVGQAIPLVTSGALTAALVNAAAARTEILQNEAGAFAERIENNTLALRLRPNQQFNRITYLDSGGDSYYHGLQIVGRRRFGRGIGANIAYTFAKSIDNGSLDPVGAASGGGLSTTTSRAPVDSRNFGLERGRSDFDRRHVFNVASVWDLPVGKGEKFGSNWHPVARHVLGNWSLNGIFTAMSGEPFSVTSGARTSNNAHVSRAVIVQSGLKAQLQEKAGVLGPLLFADASGFALPEPGTNGGPRNVFVAPRFWNADFGLIKVFQVSERFKLQFRTEVFNAVNHANVDNPRDASSGSPSILSAVFAQTCCAAVSTPSSQSIIQTGESSRVIQFALKLNF